MGYAVKDFAFRMRNDVMVKGDRHKVADVIEQQEAELATLRTENEAAQKALRLIEMYLKDGAPHSALRVAKEALK